MELPIFQDNLRSSGGWAERIASARLGWDRWKELPGGVELRDQRVHALTLRAASGWMGPGEEVSEVCLAEGISRVAQRAREERAVWQTDWLLELYDGWEENPTGSPLWRTSPPVLLSPLHDPVPASLLPRMVDLAFDWFASEGFEEMHPLEQATVVFLRLLDLHPFESPARTKLTALLVAGFYPQRAGLPPLVIDPRGAEEMARFEQSLAAAFRMLTQPLIEFFADVTLRTMREVGDPEAV
jgi:hypothetical protein